MEQVCAQAERHREKITNALNPHLITISTYFAQPKRVPKVWYDIHNLETIIQQLFTPKLRARMHFDEQLQELRMSRMPISDMTPKKFLPLPEVFLNEQTDGDETIDGSSLIREENHPDTDIALKPTTSEEFNNNNLERYTYTQRYL